MLSRTLDLFSPRMDLFDDLTLVTSVYLTPPYLLTCRVLLLLYALITLIATISTGTPFYGYFTDWTLLGIVMYLGLVPGCVYNTALVTIDANNIEKIKARNGWVRYTTWALYVVPATCVYCQVTCSQHIINSVIMLFELVFGRVPLAYCHFPLFLTISLLFLAIAVVFHAQTGVWSYEFLDTSRNMWWAYYLGVSVLFVL
ncbi:hypothetical protein BCR33DRAFT_715665, partial [Rhizoclosmatium globosum]